MKEVKSYIGETVEVTIDRPLNSLHPKHGHKYETNYGYLPGTVSGDGEELDAYVLNVDVPLEKFTGKCVAVIHRTDDDDDKLVVIPRDQEDVSDGEIRRQTEFQEKFFKSVILRK
jgi:inorganic pyrophosphatase